MPVLSAAHRGGRALADPLPVTNAILQQAGLVFRKGQFSLLAAAPGVGKSLWAMNLAIFTKVPTLFLSADSDEFTVVTRATAVMTGHTINQVTENMAQADWEEYYTSSLVPTSHIDWSYRTDIDAEYIANRILAFEEMRGLLPSLIVIDNLDHTVEDENNEYVELRSICKALQKLARDTGAHVMALHHVQGNKTKGNADIEMGDTLYKLEKIPELVLGLSRDGERSVTMTVPKNRTGRTGLRFALPLNYETATFGGYTR